VIDAHLASSTVSVGAVLQIHDELSAGDNLMIELADAGALSAHVMSALVDHLHLALDSGHIFLRPWRWGDAPLSAPFETHAGAARWTITATSPAASMGVPSGILPFSR
jgi:hypothetical protein